MKIGLIECFVQDLEVNVCTIETDEESLTIAMYWSSSPNHYDPKDKVGTFRKKMFKFKRVALDNQRVYYHLVINDHASFVTAERILPVEGMHNFRDMGGYPTMDGRRVKWGLLYRGDQLANSQASSDAYMESLKIGIIVDLRSQFEIDKSPNRCLTTWAKTYHFDPDAPIAAFAGGVQNKDIFSDAKNLIATAQTWLEAGKSGNNVMIKQQEDFVERPASKRAFQDALEVVMGLDGVSVFQHCRGGKDRTGYLAMLELMLLGVDIRYVKYDYALTNRARAQKNQAYHDKFMSMTHNRAYTDFYMSLFEAKPIFLDAALATITENYGSVLNYVKTQFGITDAAIEQFKNTVLE